MKFKILPSIFIIQLALLPNKNKASETQTPLLQQKESLKIDLESDLVLEKPINFEKAKESIKSLFSSYFQNTYWQRNLEEKNQFLKFQYYQGAVHVMNFLFNYSKNKFQFALMNNKKKDLVIPFKLFYKSELKA